MESKFDVFIKSLNNHELAIYIGYQYESLLPKSKEKIKIEVASRNLTKKKLENYWSIALSYNGVDDVKHCERCGSNKFFKDVDTEYANGEYSTHIYQVESDRCRLCYLNPSKDPPQNFFRRLKWYLMDKNKAKTKTFIKTLDWFDE